MTYDEFESTISLFESGHVGYKIRSDIYAGDHVFDEDGCVVPFTTIMEMTRGFVLAKSNCDICEFDSEVLVVNYFITVPVYDDIEYVTWYYGFKWLDVVYLNCNIMDDVRDCEGILI